MEERLQKFLASAGVASRRKAEELILAGRVKVNAAPATRLGTKVDPEKDLVTVDGRLVSAPSSRAYYLLYKPPGCVTTASDPEGRPTALDYLRGVQERVFPVGRLDWDAEGAVLFTDDGELANRLAHPRYGHRRVYLVKVKGDPAPEALLRMTAGVRLEDGPARALEADVHEHAEKNVWIRVVVGEGRYHLVKRLCEAVGLQVQRLFRPEFGGVSVQGLRSGEFRPLSPAEVRAMKQSVGLEAGTAAPLAQAMPKAARRHGRGPPAPPRARAAAGGDADEGRERGTPLRSGGAPLRDREAPARGNRRGGAPRGGGAAAESRGARRWGREEAAQGRATAQPNREPRAQGRGAVPQGRGEKRRGPRQGREDRATPQPSREPPAQGREENRGPPPQGRGHDRGAAPQGRATPQPNREPPAQRSGEIRGGPPQGRGGPPQDRGAASQGRRSSPQHGADGRARGGGGGRGPARRGERSRGRGR